MLERSVLLLKTAIDVKKMCSNNEKQSCVSPYKGEEIKLN